MLRLFHSLRFKLTALYVILFGIIQVVLYIMVVFVYESRQWSRLDERLRQRAQSMIEVVDVAADGVLERPSAGGVRPYLDAFQFPDFYYQVRLENGKVVDRSDNMRRLEFPAGTVRFDKDGSERKFETMGGRFARSLLGVNGELRVLTWHHRQPNGTPYCLQVAMDRRPFVEAVVDSRQLLAVSCLVSLLAVGVTAWVLAKRSLASIEDVGKQAEDVSPKKLDLRIEIPDRQDEVAEMVTTVNQMLDRLEQAFSEQGRFIANISHELKTPLTYLLGQAQVLRRQARTPEEYDQFVANVEDEMRRLKQTVDSFLMLARSNAGLRELGVTDISANDFVMEALERSQPLASHREVLISPSLAPADRDDADPNVRGDPELLCTMVENLVRNAIRHSPPSATVEVDVGWCDPDVAIVVRDQGPGIPEGQLERIFDEFYHASGDRSDADGVGLGLSIARAVARLHDGSLKVENRELGGAEFTVRLPLARGVQS